MEQKAMVRCAAVFAASFLYTAIYSAVAEPISVAVGGTSGLPTLQDPAATIQLRAQRGTGFYIHYSATDPHTFGPTLRKLGHLFEGHQSIAEVALGGGFTPTFWSTAWQTQVLAYGFAPNTVVVNEDIGSLDAKGAVTPHEVSDFISFVAAGRRDGGVSIFAPIASPNQSGGAGSAGDAKTIAFIHPWESTWWDGLRTMARIGGGIALDAPPAFFLRGLPDQTQTNAYRRFEEAVLNWAQQERIWSAEIISPYFDAINFEADGRELYRILLNANSLPKTWIFENYSDCGVPFTRTCNASDACFLVPIGYDSQYNTISSLALWFSKNAKTAK